MYNAVVIS